MSPDEFRASYPANPPRIEPRHPDERIAMTVADGLFALGTPPADASIIADLPRDETAAAQRHLWVIAEHSEPCALEDCEFAKRHVGLERGWIKHTNLTGCAPAHCGGELWFLHADTLVINGNSGRYGPRDIDQLRCAGSVLRELGYKVASMGYDEDLKRFAATVVGEEDLEWL